MKRITKLRDTLARLPDLKDSQIGITLLQNCLALPKISFSLRTCTPNFIRDALTSFYDTIRETLSTIVGSPLEQWSWIKASLPYNLGGLGLRSAVEHAPAAYFSSLSQQAPLVSAILDRGPGTFQYLATSVHLLASAADKQHWKNATNIDIPHHQRLGLLSNIIDKAV